MPLNVTSEIGKLREVMIHLPGVEIDRMVPSMMEELLFDDILFGDRAREEHRRLQRLLAFVADEVFDLRDLLVEVLGDGSTRAQVVADIERKLEPGEAVMEILRAADAPALARDLCEGILRPGVTKLPENPADLFLLAPVPNLFFQRDPAVVVGDRVVIASMATRARLREPLLAGWVYDNHPRFRTAQGASPLLFETFRPITPAPSLTDGQHLGRARPRPTLEGGDVLVVSDSVLLVGVSIRTERKTIQELADRLREEKSTIRKIILVEIPKSRSFMHLDTVFTIIGPDECLIYEPAVLPGGVEEVDVYQVDVDKREMSMTSKSSLLDALRGCGVDLRPIPCGGEDDPIAQQREQWTDGANAFCLAPGVILCYERNVRTAEQLHRNGWEIVDEDDLLLGRRELETGPGKKTAIMLEGHELSRARGGPRCMTMPLVRDPL